MNVDPQFRYYPHPYMAMTRLLLPSPYEVVNIFVLDSILDIQNIL